jgi:hypothetical protein
MTAPDTAAACEAIRCSLRDAVAHLIKVGGAAAEMAVLFAREGIADQFPGFCGEALGIPHPEALLLARWAADRPAWANPEAVDLSDPLADELLELAIRHTARSLGMPPADLAASEVSS